MIDPGTHREVFRLHHESCSPCARLFAYVRERGDLHALAAWRKQLGTHLENWAIARCLDGSHVT